MHRELLEEFSYTDWHGNPVIQQVDQWMLRKTVRGDDASTAVETG
ncbi:MAG TPA: hypothetical protein VFS20_21950 [Longimicrobium sp.]|nr:hypothetical protein [Longimicrobium sp.]